jgi:hypothetical protein
VAQVVDDVVVVAARVDHRFRLEEAVPGRPGGGVRASCCQHFISLFEMPYIKLVARVFIILLNVE